MIEGFIRVFGECLFEYLFVRLWQLLTLQIYQHPYLTCLYRGFVLGMVFFAGLVIWRLLNAQSLASTLLQDISLSLTVMLGIALLLAITTFIRTLFFDS